MSQNQAYPMDDTRLAELARTFVHDVRNLISSTELKKGAPKPFLSDSVPDKDDFEGLIIWIFLLIQAALKLVQERIKLNHSTYSSSATRSSSNNKKTEENNTDNAEDSKGTESILDAETEDEYENLLKNKQLLIQRLKAHEYSNKYQKAKIESDLKIVNQRLKELEKKRAASSAYGQESESSADTTSTQEQTEETSSTVEEPGVEDEKTEEDKTSASVDDQDSAISEEFIEDGKAHDSLDKEITKKLKETARQTDSVSEYTHALMQRPASQYDKLEPVVTTTKEYSDVLYELDATRSQETVCVFSSRPTMAIAKTVDFRNSTGDQLSWSGSYFAH